MKITRDSQENDFQKVFEKHTFCEFLVSFTTPELLFLTKFLLYLKDLNTKILTYNLLKTKIFS